MRSRSSKELAPLLRICRRRPRGSACSGCGARRRHLMMHVVVHVMHVMHVVHVVMMLVAMMHPGRFGVSGRTCGRRPGLGLGRRRFLGEGVTRKADCESGRDDKALDHGSTFLVEEDPLGLHGI